jgi:hypothetical protein
VQARLDNGDPDQTEWLRKIACQESGQTQFVSTTATPSGYRYPGEPLMSYDGLGGAGIMQITVPQPTFAELWDWRANVDAGRSKYSQNLSTARNFPSRVRQHPGFQILVNNTNTWQQQNNMPAFQSIRVPAFAQWQINEDAVRSYNGFGDTDPLFPAIGGSNALPRHEFTLMTRQVQIQGSNVLILDIRDLGGGMAEAQWRRVLVSERAPVGDPNYVENVRGRDPTCP